MYYSGRKMNMTQIITKLWRILFYIINMYNDSIFISYCFESNSSWAKGSKIKMPSFQWEKSWDNIFKRFKHCRWYLKILNALPSNDVFLVCQQIFFNTNNIFEMGRTTMKAYRTVVNSPRVTTLLSAAVQFYTFHRYLVSVDLKLLGNRNIFKE